MAGPGPVRRGRANTLGEMPRIVTAAELAPVVVTPARMSFRTIVADLKLSTKATAGKVVVKPAIQFERNEIGAPVFVSLVPDPSGPAIAARLQFSGQVVDAGQIQVHWTASGPVPARVTVNILVGNSGG